MTSSTSVTHYMTLPTAMLRDAGLSRFKASTVCWAVNNFAKSHYGLENDYNDCYLFANLTVYTERE